METNSQQPEGQPAAAPVTTGQPAAEPQKAANLNQAVEKATAESANPAPKQEGQPEDWEWDGNPNTLPPQFAKYGKGIQRYFTKRSMTESELRKAGEEHAKFVQSEEYKQFQTYKKSLNQALPPQQELNVPKQRHYSQEEWENALLDPSGEKMADLIERVAERKLRSTEEKVQQTVSQFQQATNTAHWNAALSDFAEIHPEAVEYHNMGLMEPIVRQELASGKHNSYESVLNTALERVDKSVQAIRQQEQAKAQGRIQEKKAAVVNTGTAVGDFSIVEVEKGEALDKAIEFGMTQPGKRVKVRSKR